MVSKRSTRPEVPVWPEDTVQVPGLPTQSLIVPAVPGERTGVHTGAGAAPALDLELAVVPVSTRTQDPRSGRQHSALPRHSADLPSRLRVPLVGKTRRVLH